MAKKGRRGFTQRVKTIAGEMSKLRWGIFNPLGWKMIGGRIGAGYRLDTSRVDVDLARSLYNNTNDMYKLGAGFAKPIVNTTVGFMGLPNFVMEDEKAQEIMDAFMAENQSKNIQALRNAIREGDAYVWLTREDEYDKMLYPESPSRIKFNLIMAEEVSEIRRDPLTNEITAYVLKSERKWTDENGSSRSSTITQTITATERIIEVEGDPLPEIGTGTTLSNPWGFIPILHFRNEAEEFAQFGRSDLEVVEPFMKAYHDVMFHAIKGSQMHSTPRLKLKVRDVAGFLRNNFGVEDPAKWAREGGTIDLNGHEILFFQDDEDASFVEARSTIGDATTLLEFIFYCIVDASEMPEFVFGVHTPSSLASVKEQMPILIRRITRKRASFDLTFKRMARIVLAMSKAADPTLNIQSFKGELEWDDIDPRDGKDTAQEIKNIAEALKIAIESGFTSEEAAVDFFAEYITTMNYWDDPEAPTDQREKARIMRTRLNRQRLEDGQALDEQRAQIERDLEEAARQQQTG